MKPNPDKFHARGRLRDKVDQSTGPHVELCLAIWPYVSDDDDTSDPVALLRMIADRMEEDLRGNALAVALGGKPGDVPTMMPRDYVLPPDSPRDERGRLRKPRKEKP